MAAPAKRFLIDSNIFVHASGLGGDIRLPGIDKRRPDARDIVPAGVAQKAALGLIGLALAHGSILVSAPQQSELHGLCRKFSSNPQVGFLQTVSNKYNAVPAPFAFTNEEINGLTTAFPKDMELALAYSEKENARENATRQLFDSNAIVPNSFREKNFSSLGFSPSSWTDYLLYRAALQTGAQVITEDKDLGALHGGELTKKNTRARPAHLMVFTGSMQQGLDFNATLPGISSQIVNAQPHPEAPFLLVKGAIQASASTPSSLLAQQARSRLNSSFNPPGSTGPQPANTPSPGGPRV